MTPRFVSVCVEHALNVGRRVCVITQSTHGFPIQSDPSVALFYPLSIYSLRAKSLRRLNITIIKDKGSLAESDAEWRAILSPEQFKILREKDTERAGMGKYNKFNEEGIYTCAACNTPLYKSTTKFNSGCGWLAFFDAIPGAVSRHEDRKFGMLRTEITCTAYGGHLGHVFKGEGFDTPTDERHCVNSVSLNFGKEVPQEA
ncbi:Peptide methionine sulfoxide reductase B2, chloroplastic [Tulasnella sp. JGI-2019a]|nr:Peptide methionine sulfoxide reductase B2, chloroplastic [Tulasnella sp. JGI-2019a]